MLFFDIRGLRVKRRVLTVESERRPEILVVFLALDEPYFRRMYRRLRR